MYSIAIQANLFQNNMVDEIVGRSTEGADYRIFTVCTVHTYTYVPMYVLVHIVRTYHTYFKCTQLSTVYESLHRRSSVNWL